MDGATWPYKTILVQHLQVQITGKGLIKGQPKDELADLENGRQKARWHNELKFNIPLNTN